MACPHGGIFLTRGMSLTREMFLGGNVPQKGSKYRRGSSATGGPPTGTLPTGTLPTGKASYGEGCCWSIDTADAKFLAT